MKDSLIALGSLVKRGLKIFLKDKASVFFSLLAPLIVLVLYVLFLGDVQLQTMQEAVKDLPGTFDEKVMKAFVNGWMLAGAVSVACITVSFSAQTVMVRDREAGISNDLHASPLKGGTITFSYFLVNFAITAVICFVVLVIAFVYLAVTGWYLSGSDVAAIVGLLLLSMLSSCVISTLVCWFIRSTAAHAAFVGIMSAAIGFLCGAYMPLSMFPAGVQYAVLFLPGTYSAGSFRVLFMGGALEKLSMGSAEAAEMFSKAMSMKLNFFGQEIGLPVMAGILAASVALFLAIDLVVLLVRAKRSRRQTPRAE